MDLQDLLTRRESETLDFKREFHVNNAELLHDILCLSNSISRENRHLIFGVTNSGAIHGTDNDPNRKTNADLHDFLRQVPLNKIPEIDLTFHKHQGKEIAIVEISDRADKPYFLLRDFRAGKIKIRAGAIYTRLGDTNVPAAGTAPEGHVELMWKERFGLLGKEPPDFETTFPISLGDSREKVHSILGDPSATGWQIEQFYNEGIEVSYDQHFDFVDALCIYPLPAGTAFVGKLCGIKLGDSFTDARNVLGQPAHWGLAYENGSLAVWEIQDKLLVTEIWSVRHRNTSVATSQLGTIKSIAYCERKSTVGYNAMVAIVIEKIRRDITPTEFERNNLLEESQIDRELFDDAYDLLGARPALFGGQEVLVGFPTSKRVIAFWIYPLEWRYPVVRAIYELGKRDEYPIAQENDKNGDNLSKYQRIEKLMSGLLDEMRTDLAQYPLRREIVLLAREWAYWAGGDELIYYFDDHNELAEKFGILENEGFVRNTKYNDVARFRMTEDFAKYLGAP